MSRYRTIHCLIWNDDKFPFVSDDCQLAFFHLLTTPMSTPFGLFKAGMGALAEEKRWPVERYQKAFQEALSNGFVKHDAKHLVVFIPKFLDYNPPGNPNVLQSWGKVFDEVPDCGLKCECCQQIRALAESYSEAFAKAFAKAFPKGVAKGIGNQEQDQEQDHPSAHRRVALDGPTSIDQNLPAASTAYSADFETAWAHYPKRAGGNPKRRAWNVWRARRKEGVPVGALLDGVRRYSSWCDATGKTATEYVLQAATFYGPDRRFTEAWELPPDGHAGGEPETNLDDSPDPETVQRARNQLGRGNRTTSTPPLSVVPGAAGR